MSLQHQLNMKSIPCVRPGLVARKGGRGSRAGEPIADAKLWPLASGGPGLDALGGPDPFTVPVGSFTACTSQVLNARLSWYPSADKFELLSMKMSRHYTTCKSINSCTLLGAVPP